MLTPEEIKDIEEYWEVDKKYPLIHGKATIKKLLHDLKVHKKALINEAKKMVDGYAFETIDEVIEEILQRAERKVNND